MNAPRTGTGGLTKAQRRVADLVIDLDWTLDSAKRLADAGEHEAALRVVQEQREALSAFIDDIAVDIAATPTPSPAPARNPFVRAYKRVVAIAAAMTLVVCTIAAAFAAVRDDGDVAKADAQLQRAQQIGDPEARFVALAKIAETTHALPADGRKGALTTKLSDALDRTGDDLEHGSRDATMASEARRLAQQLRRGEVPSGPPQSLGRSPIDALQEELNRR